VCRVHGRSRAAGVIDRFERSVGTLEVPIAVRKGGKNKAPGSDGTGLEFYKANWETIQDDICAMMNQMFMEKKVSVQQKHGVIRVPAQVK
jgi:hypothetical protein